MRRTGNVRLRREAVIIAFVISNEEGLIMSIIFNSQFSIFNKNSNFKLRNGFTLIELLVTIGIIAILVVIGVVSYGSINRRSRDTRRMSDIEQIRSALEMYRADNGFYPNVGAGVFVDVEQLRDVLVTVNSYLPTIPEDPKDNEVNPYMVIFQKDPAQENYYRYCIAAVLEGTGETNCVGASLPDGYTYGTRNP
jgi:type II secretion system protein G